MVKPVIYCALDTIDINTATEWAQAIGPITGGIKLG